MKIKSKWIAIALIAILALVGIYIYYNPKAEKYQKEAHTPVADKADIEMIEAPDSMDGPEYVEYGQGAYVESGREAAEY
jgi:uncharacterized protein YpmB